jgi:signal transduction histidine kinase/ligand-binding sensor domain-containing protein
MERFNDWLGRLRLPWPQIALQSSIRRCFLPLVILTALDLFAVDPHTLISQYAHTAWRIQDGAIAKPTTNPTQTSDGYIWIGMSGGLMRFDGVKFTPWTPPDRQSLPGNPTDLLGARDGSLWIATTDGLSHFKDGVLFTYATKSAGVSGIIEDHNGTIWVTRYRIKDEMGPLCRVAGETLQCYGKKDGILAKYGLGLAEDSAGNIWFGGNVLYRWSPNSSSVYFEEELKHRAGDGVGDVATGPSGTVWAGLDATGPSLGVQYYSNGKWSGYVVPGFNGAMIRSTSLFIDRNQSLWIGTQYQGLYRIHNGVADHYGSANGLSGNGAYYVYEDREGNLWVVTDRGVDMFRDTPVVTYSTNEGLVGSNTHSILALTNGSVWVGNDEALDIIHPGGISVIDAVHGLPGHDVNGMFQDHAGQIWLGVDDTVKTYKPGRFSDIKKADGNTARHVGAPVAFAEDIEGNIWVATYSASDVVGQRHLRRITNQRLEEDIRLDTVMRGGSFLVADREAGIWIGSRGGNLVRFRNGKPETAFSLANDESRVITSSLSVDSDNALWIATNKGLFRWKDGSLTVLDSRNGLPCSGIYSVIKDDYGFVWLAANCGYMRVPGSDWESWLKSPQTKLSVRTFGVLDGAQSAVGESDQPIVTKSPDGRLWFASDTVIQMIDPSRSYTNEIPPPVHIEKLIVDHKSYDGRQQLSLPPLKGQLEVDYTALSFTVPQRVLFRYKLEGHDPEWQEPGTRRQAFYNNLRPGRYTFRVIACNSDGVWNEEGAMLEFSIAPRWYQTAWFVLFCVVIVSFVVWALYQLRVRQLAKAMSSRFDERLAERTRLARDLHDTFLQTIQGSKLIADHALKDRDDQIRMVRAMEQLSAWLEQATEQGRAALNSLRTSSTETNDLAEAFRRAIGECGLQNSMQGSFSVSGDAKAMHPIVRDEVYRIGYEAIRNACTHSRGTEMEVTLSYGHDLMVRVKDDGIGIEPTVAEKGRDGHFGLQGMRERAARIGATLTIVNPANSGTDVTLVVPGRVVFRKSGPRDSND